MNVGSLFSGIGGIELGLESAGMRTEWFVECEAFSQSIIRQHWPRAKIYDDVTKIDWRTVPEVDILTGGFPCQDISNAGKRVGITGSRSSLWKHYCQAIRLLRPRYCLIENVSALIGRGLDIVLADLAEIGYDAEWYCVPASAVGAPHRRDRVFILAYPNSSGHIHRQPKEQSAERGESAQCESESGSEDVADTMCKRLEGQGDAWATSYKSIEGWWSIEPRMGRMAHGVPYRVDRIKGLGNAVVPQVAEVFGKAIMKVKT